MLLEFKTHQLKEGTKIYEQLIQKELGDNEFVIVGETDLYYKAQQLTEGKILLIGGLNIQDTAYLIPKTDLKIKSDGYSCELLEFDIQKKFLSMEIIEDIKRLNS